MKHYWRAEALDDPEINIIKQQICGPQTPVDFGQHYAASERSVTNFLVP